jgi:hypothetical protein
MMVDSGFRDLWRDGDHGHHDGGGEKLYIIHLDSPKVPLSPSCGS